MSQMSNLREGKKRALFLVIMLDYCALRCWLIHTLGTSRHRMRNSGPVMRYLTFNVKLLTKLHLIKTWNINFSSKLKDEVR